MEREKNINPLSRIEYITIIVLIISLLIIFYPISEWFLLKKFVDMFTYIVFILTIAAISTSFMNSKFIEERHKEIFFFVTVSFALSGLTLFVAHGINDFDAKTFWSWVVNPVKRVVPFLVVFSTVFLSLGISLFIVAVGSPVRRIYRILISPPDRS